MRGCLSFSRRHCSPLQAESLAAGAGLWQIPSLTQGLAGASSMVGQVHASEGESMPPSNRKQQWAWQRHSLAVHLRQDLLLPWSHPSFDTIFPLYPRC